MSEEYIYSAVVILVLSVIVNTLFQKFNNWRKARRERRRQAETPIEDARPFRIDVQNNRPVTPPLPVRPQNTSSNGNSRTPQTPSRPSVQTVLQAPVLASPGVPSDPLDYPMCPIHRCRNRRGKPGMISWDNDRKMWKCQDKHYFNS